MNIIQTWLIASVSFWFRRTNQPTTYMCKVVFGDLKKKQQKPTNERMSVSTCANTHMHTSTENNETTEIQM